VVTSRLPEAFLACPVKCHLLSEGKVPAGTEYSAWAAARDESCRREGVRKLTSQETGPSIAAAEPGLWKHESWRFAVGKTVRAEGWDLRRKDAVGEDELSLLSNLTGKERAKYRGEGIFTVSQRAYTFRPRRRGFAASI